MGPFSYLKFLLQRLRSNFADPFPPVTIRQRAEGMIQPIFHDRHDAGRQLARALHRYAEAPDLLVLGLPRGGVPVAFEVARAFDGPLDIFMVRKLGVPGQEELAMGAIATGDVLVWNDIVLDQVQLSRGQIDAVIARERVELERREIAYRGDRPHPRVRGRSIILIDDGLATGASMRAAAAALREQEPRRLVVAVPVAARETCDEFRSEVDDVVCAATPEPFFAVGLWYEDFSPTSDDDVRALLRRAHPAGKEAG